MHILTAIYLSVGSEYRDVWHYLVGVWLHHQVTGCMHGYSKELVRLGRDIIMGRRVHFSPCPYLDDCDRDSK